MIGIDLVYLPEFQKQLEIGGDKLLRKSFDTIDLRHKDSEHLAGLWAAKEAVTKAGSLTPESWNSIHITYDKQGRPQATVGSDNYEISIAHHGEYAVAVAHKL